MIDIKGSLIKKTENVNTVPVNVWTSERNIPYRSTKLVRRISNKCEWGSTLYLDCTNSEVYTVLE